MFRSRILVFTMALAMSVDASAFESDVHFGLTKWLALQAGFSPQQAEFIATGNQRADSGLISSLEVVFEYACFTEDVRAANVVQQLHYPGSGPVPAEPSAREVVPGGEAARKTVSELISMAKDKAGFLLFKFGEALHALQDSWSHQGVPDVPRPSSGAIECNPSLYWGHSAARGGWKSHKADLTSHWTEDGIAMAAATYELLQQYPPILGDRRAAKEWAEIRSLLEDFIKAPTKSAKEAWFISNGMTDTSFLEGISLPDGADALDLHWSGHKLPPLASARSPQFGVPANILDFFNDFVSRWLSTDDFSALLDQSMSEKDRNSDASDPEGIEIEKVELLARLKLWRVHDHGSVAALAHVERPLDARQLATVSELTKDPGVYARYESLSDAFFPLLAKGPNVSPLLPFVVHVLPQSDQGSPRAAVVMKLRHAPYDALALIAEQTDGHWNLVSIVSVVDH